MSEALRFDKTVTMGNLLMILTLVAGMLIAWFKMESRIVMVETMTSQNRVLIDKQMAILNRLEISTSRLSTLMDIYVPLHPLTEQDVARATHAERNQQ